jgi:omega-6 fatty acid desaturase (delta-12 desaturase)
VDRLSYREIRMKFQFSKGKWTTLAIYLLQDFLLMALTAAVWNRFSESYLRFAAIPVLSILIFRNFAMMHDAVHNCVSKYRIVNDAMGVWCGAISFLPFESWSVSHLDHHYWSGNLERDPVLMLMRSFPNFPRPLKKVLSFGWRSWLPLIGFAQQVVFWTLSWRQFVKAPTNARLGISLAAPMALWSVVAWFSGIDFVMQIAVPGAVLYLIAVEAVNFPHHMQLASLRSDEHLAAKDQHENARSCVYPKWFARFVTLNFNYHVEHHMFPDAPWYVLDKLQPLVETGLGSSYRKDMNLEWIFRSRKVPIGRLLENPVRSPRDGGDRLITRKSG